MTVSACLRVYNFVLFSLAFCQHFFQISKLFSLGPSHTNAPVARGTPAFKFPRICGSTGEPVVHIFVSLASFMLFIPLFVKTDTRHQGCRPNFLRSDGTLLCLSSHSFLPSTRTSHNTSQREGVWEWGLPVKIYNLLHRTRTPHQMRQHVAKMKTASGETPSSSNLITSFSTEFIKLTLI